MRSWSACGVIINFTENNNIAIKHSRYLYLYFFVTVKTASSQMAATCKHLKNDMAK